MAESLMKGLQATFASKNKYPLPDGPFVTIAYMGTTIGWQGYAGQNVLPQAHVAGNMLDPLTGTSFTYNTNATQTSAQIMGYLENINNYAFNDENLFVQTAFAAGTPNYASLYPFVKGDTL